MADASLDILIYKKKIVKKMSFYDLLYPVITINLL